jgi:hypothetical protein
LNDQQRAERRLAFLKWMMEKNLLRFVPWRFLRQVVYPLTVRGPKKPYEAARFFDSYYRMVGEDEFSDRITLGPTMPPLHARYHYNLIENSIIQSLHHRSLPERPVVLDLGSGAGHWIDFYRNTFDASHVVGLEISAACAASLRAKYGDREEVTIVEGDIADDAFALDRTFDLINAVGVMFHIVDDEMWERTLVKFRKALIPDGFIVVGGQFGWFTRNVQFHATDDFDKMEDLIGKSERGDVSINKRTRSYRRWKRAAGRAGLRVARLIRTRNVNEMITAENNILLLEHAKR